LAATTRLSPSTFHAAFRTCTGETVKQHTLRIRLERAALRLLTEQTSVSDIAFDLASARTRRSRGLLYAVSVLRPRRTAAARRPG
jgi:AraC-like DNA-binding protein